MRCPDCHTALDLVTARGVQLDLCPICGLLRRKEYDDADAVVTGWYRRAPVPYVEINTLQTGTGTLRAWVYPLQLFACWIAIIVGAGIAVLL